MSVSDASRGSGLGTTYSRMHWKAQKMPGKYSAAPIVGPIQCVDGEFPVQPKMLWKRTSQRPSLSSSRNSPAYKSEIGMNGVANSASLSVNSCGSFQSFSIWRGMK